MEGHNYGLDATRTAYEAAASCHTGCTALGSLIVIDGYECDDILKDVHFSSSLLNWPLNTLLAAVCEPGTFSLKWHVCRSKTESLVDQVNPNYTHMFVRYPDGREATLSLFWASSSSWKGRGQQ